MAARRMTWLFVSLLTLSGAAVLLASLELRQSQALARSTALVFDIPAELEEDEVPIESFWLGWAPWNRHSVYGVVEGLGRAARDDRIAALVLHIDEVSWGWAKLSEVRDAIQKFRSAGKPVYACLEGGGEAEYYLATAADVVAAPPAAVLQLDGLTATTLFFRGTFDKLDISPNFATAGRYKSGAEPYTHTRMTPDTREALDALLDDEYGLLVDSLAAARAMSPDSVRRLLDEGPYEVDEALESGLVDAILHVSELDSLALNDDGRELPSITLTRYMARARSHGGGPRIALVAASGAIVPGRSRYVPGEGRSLGAETVIDALREARTRSSIKAVVLRIDSPGGWVTASDDIWREIKRCRAAKPVIVSMSDYAASGGYYIAAAAQRIVAQPSTLTGSIGVWGGKLNVYGLYRKLGLEVETLSRGRHAEMMSELRDFTPEEAARFKRHMDESYELFLSRVSEGRGFDRATAESVSQGRVWSGLEARARGLVDTLGGIETALEIARAEAGLDPEEEFVVEPLPGPEHPFLESLLHDWFGEDDGEANGGLVPPPVLRAWLAVARFPVGAALALMPYSVVIR